MLGVIIAIYYNDDNYIIRDNAMTKPKPKNELKAYRGKQSYLTEEQIRMLKSNPNIVKATDRQVHYTQTFASVCKVINDYMDYYNNHRYQWELLYIEIFIISISLIV